jgi:hypothetical protein
MNEIIRSDSEHIKITPYSLEFEFGTTPEEAIAIGGQLLRAYDQIQWYLGDWIIYCSGLSGWGKQYEAALEKTAYKYQTLVNTASVCHRFPPNVRSNYTPGGIIPSFARFKAVASCTDEQVTYLFGRMVEEGWSRLRLEEEVQKLKHPTNRMATWLRVNVLDPLWRSKVLSVPHIDRKIGKDKRPVYLLTGMDELPELTDGGKNDTQ